jgi:hypothetical protein
MPEEGKEEKDRGLGTASESFGEAMTSPLPVTVGCAKEKGREGNGG